MINMRFQQNVQQLVNERDHLLQKLEQIQTEISSSVKNTLEENQSIEDLIQEYRTESLFSRVLIYSFSILVMTFVVSIIPTILIDFIISSVFDFHDISLIIWLIGIFFVFFVYSTLIYFFTRRIFIPLISFVVSAIVLDISVSDDIILLGNFEVACTIMLICSIICTYLFAANIKRLVQNLDTTRYKLQTNYYEIIQLITPKLVHFTQRASLSDVNSISDNGFRFIPNHFIEAVLNQQVEEGKLEKFHLPESKQTLYKPVGLIGNTDMETVHLEID